MVVKASRPGVRRLALRSALALLPAAALSGTPAPAIAVDLYDAGAIPHVGNKARQSYFELFLSAAPHRAFAIAPGGAWAWTSGTRSAREAQQMALAECRERTEWDCALYAVDDRVTFSRAQWARMWRPYPSAEQARGAQVGTNPGQRFPNLAFKDFQGATYSVAGLRGKVTLLHFWGSWCPTCAREIPSLDRFHRILGERLSNDVAVVLLQVREPVEQSRKWLEQQDIKTLPLFDSGSQGDQDHYLTTVENSKIPDRDIAMVFPSSFVLDRNGLVIFSHRGPVKDWTEYFPFFEDAVFWSAR